MKQYDPPLQLLDKSFVYHAEIQLRMDEIENAWIKGIPPRELIESSTIELLEYVQLRFY